MLSLLLCWLLVAGVTLIIGWSVWRVAAKVGLLAGQEALPLELLSLLGLSILAMVLGISSLFFSVGLSSQTAVGVVVLGLLVGQQAALRRTIRNAWRAAHPLQAIVFAGVLAVLGSFILWKASLGIRNPDSGLYHVQSIRWIVEYPALVGLGNLHGRLAFNSSVFQLMALARYMSPVGPVYSLSGYFFTLVAVATARSVTAPLRGKPADDARLIWLAPLWFLLLLQVYGPWLSSPSPDWVPPIVCFFLFFQYARKWERGQGRQLDSNTLLILLLALFAVTAKLSALPILLLPLHSLWASRHQLNRRWIIVCLVALLVVLGPWVARNVLQTGYLVYPLPALDVLAVDWKIPINYVRQESYMVTNYARRVAQPICTVPAPLWSSWLARWWIHFLEPFNRVLLVAVLLSPLLAAFRWWRRTDAENGWAAGWLIGFVGSVFWFLAGPDIRFGTGFLFVAATWPLIGPRWPSRRGLVAGLPLVVMVAWGIQHLRDPFYQLRTLSSAITSCWIWPTPIPEAATRPLALRNGLQVTVPVTGDKCWNAPLPCVQCAEVGVELRGATIADGFRTGDNAPAEMCCLPIPKTPEEELAEARQDSVHRARMTQMNREIKLQYR
ncbi:LIC_10190 family membrane protein [Hymenobacter jejuensis]|uniref:DUF8201 domain-containing protein n=1 Tax=Hymenobacter jejuensis TaxID=2502781 RepID=A0A5B7ZW49_9BACT|nr:hypothetical protein [Hymenobacter jejuensis]QDA59371.1 hypothetical protein FHG12_04295 [Hymenobacter jejuensis]